MMIYWTKANPCPMYGMTVFDSIKEAADFLEEVRRRQQKWDTTYYRVHSGLVANAMDIGLCFHGGGIACKAGELFALLKGAAAERRASGELAELARLVRILVEMRGLDFDVERRVWQGCSRKKGYSQGDARRKAEQVRLLTREHVAEYHCDECGAWHIGH